MRIIVNILMLLLLNIAVLSASELEKMHANTIEESYIMLYYKELGAARQFYGKLLGLQATFEDDWVSLFRITPTSYVGVVKEGEGAWHKVQETNAVMLSLVVSDVDAWYERVRADKTIKILKPIYNNKNAPIRAFLIADPGAYSVEIFQWQK